MWRNVLKPLLLSKSFCSVWLHRYCTVDNESFIYNQALPCFPAWPKPKKQSHRSLDDLVMTRKFRLHFESWLKLAYPVSSCLQLTLRSGQQRLLAPQWSRQSAEKCRCWARTAIAGKQSMILHRSRNDLTMKWQLKKAFQWLLILQKILRKH